MEGTDEKGGTCATMLLFLKKAMCEEDREEKGGPCLYVFYVYMPEEEEGGGEMNVRKEKAHMYMREACEMSMPVSVCLKKKDILSL